MSKVQSDSIFSEMENLLSDKNFKRTYAGFTKLELRKEAAENRNVGKALYIQSVVNTLQGLADSLDGFGHTKSAAYATKALESFIKSANSTFDHDDSGSLYRGLKRQLKDAVRSPELGFEFLQSAFDLGLTKQEVRELILEQASDSNEDGVNSLLDELDVYDDVSYDDEELERLLEATRNGIMDAESELELESEFDDSY